MKPDEAAVTFCDGSVLHASQCEAGFGHEWMTAVVKLTSSLRRAPSVDLSSVASLAALTLVTGILPSPFSRLLPLKYARGVFRGYHLGWPT